MLDPRTRITLAALVGLRLLLSALRLVQDPRRFWNFEEAYNATVAWAATHAGVGEHLLELQYRTFCGGCTVVAALGAPILALSDALLAWKLVAMAWTAATMVVGFFALDGLIGRPAAWAWAALMAVPAMGPADLSLMLWGNHQETALFGVSALLLLARGHGGAAGAVLGLGVWFCRTAAYGALVLVPAGLILLPVARARLLGGFALGLLPLLLPSAGGDAGYYRMDEALGQPVGVALERASTLLSPGQLAARLYMPRTGRGDVVLGLAWLAAAVVAAGVLLWRKQARFLVVLPLGYLALYAFTRFPLFHVRPTASLNNIRYLSPWAFSITLLIAAGVGVAWSGRRQWALLTVALPLVANAVVWAEVLRWNPKSALLDLRATYEPYFVQVARARLDWMAEAADAPSDARGRALVQRLAGVQLGERVRSGKVARADALSRADTLGGEALRGLGLGLTPPCGDPGLVRRDLADRSPESALALAQGAAVSLGGCGQRRGLEEAVARLRGEEGCLLCGAAGPALLASCDREDDLVQLGRCLGATASAYPERDVLLWGAGLFFQQPMRPPAESVAVEAGLGANAAPFREGLEDPMGGSLPPPDRR